MLGEDGAEDGLVRRRLRRGTVTIPLAKAQRTQRLEVFYNNFKKSSNSIPA